MRKSRASPKCGPLTADAPPNQAMHTSGVFRSPAALGGQSYPKRELIFPGFLARVFYLPIYSVITAALILPGGPCCLFLELVNPSNSHAQQARNATSRLGDWTPFHHVFKCIQETNFFHSSSAKTGSRPISSHVETKGTGVDTTANTRVRERRELLTYLALRINKDNDRT
ncbi:hypothetical protein GGI35DRAFT_455499 [Trichoderma velutinum]